MSSDTILIPRFQMTRNQCVSAREMLGWDQTRLSHESGVSLLAVGMYEAGMRRLRPISLQAIAYVFEKQGLVFLNGEPPIMGANVRGCCPNPCSSPDYYLLE